MYFKYVVSTIPIFKTATLDYFKGNLRSLQSVVGEPMYPSGQVHLGVWFITLQFAVGAHGLPTAHGFIHWLFLHAAQSGHSSLSEQPTAKAGSVGFCTIKNFNWMK